MPLCLLAPGGRVDAGGGRQWWRPNISSLSRGRGKLGADPVRMLFEHVAGPTGADGAPGVFCCGLRVISMDGSPSFAVRDRPDRASPRKTKKAGDFPARKPGEPRVTKVTRTIEFHLLCPWQLT